MERSSFQYAPTVNIVMSYDPEAIIAFQESADFTSFVNHRKLYDEKMKATQGDKYVPQTHIFNNSPNSSFVSLEHTYGMGDEAGITVEIMDPQGVFEESMLNNSVDGFFDINENPVGSALLEKRESLIFLKSERQKAAEERDKVINTGPGSFTDRMREYDEYTSQIASYDDIIADTEKEIDEFGAMDDTSVDQQNMAVLRKQVNARTTQFQRPVYVTYGCGESLQDWAPITVFHKITTVEYSFTGEGVRSLKLGLLGVGGIHPNLNRGFGIKPFGPSFAKGLLTQGISDRIFNIEAAKDQATKFKSYISKPTLTSPNGAGLDEDEIIEKYIGDPTRPSFHRAVKTAIERFIKNGSNYENVLVLLPDLDQWLESYISGIYRSLKFRLMGALPSYAQTGMDMDTVAYLKGFEQGLEGIGLTLAETLPDNETGVVGTNVIGNLEEECSYAKEAEEWFEKRAIYAKMECDYVAQTFLEKLEQVGRAIADKVRDYNDGYPKLGMMSSPIVETDFGMLQRMERAGIISSSSKPCVIWGSRTYLSNYIEARLLESEMAKVQELGGADAIQDVEEGMTQQELEAFADTQVKKFVHPLDQLEGVDLNYMRSVIDYVMPLPWVGPFGPNNSGKADEFSYPHDSNQTTSKLQDLKRKQPLKASRMPVFSFGTRNPNVLSVDFDINAQFLAGLSMAKDMSIPSQAVVAGLIPTSFRSTAERMFDEIQKLDINDVDDNGVPRGFKELVEPYYDADWWNGDDVEGFDEWSAVFDNLGDDAYKNISDMTFTGSEAEADFYKFMWKAFQALYAKIRPTPTSIRNLPGRSPTKKTMTNSVAFADQMASTFMKGKITTTPLFNLASTRRCMMRNCLLYCIEPRFRLSQDMGSVRANTTWFSGLYQIVGYKHSIDSSRAESEFLLVKGAGKGAKLNDTATIEEGDN
jgi:hypothetical protein